MPNKKRTDMTPEELAEVRANDKIYYKNNPRKAYQINYHDNLSDEKKEEIKKRTDEYVNRLEIKEKMFITRNLPENIKKARINNWKKTGITYNNWDELYEKYINTSKCELCNINLVSGKTAKNRRILDHDHITNQVRNIICHSCNTTRDLKELPQLRKQLLSLQNEVKELKNRLKNYEDFQN